MKRSEYLKKKVQQRAIAIFTRQLATMIDAGIPLVQALGILSEQIDNKSLKAVVIVVRQDIEAGMSFCDALSKHPAVFF
jgi:type IV pilus assembly protein PilC